MNYFFKTCLGLRKSKGSILRWKLMWASLKENPNIQDWDGKQKQAKTRQGIGNGKGLKDFLTNF